MKITKISLFAFLASFTLVSCSGENEEIQESTEVMTEEAADVKVVHEDADLDKELQFKIDLIIGNNITGPSKVISEVRDQGFGRFQEDLVIPMNEARSYEGTITSKGLTLGSLGVDVTYLSVYDRPDLALKYIATINKLNIDLDCGMVIDASAIDAFEEAKEDGQKMSQLMFDQYFLMEDNMKSNAKLELASHVMVGGVVESFYISTSQLLATDLSEELISIIYGQKQVVTDLLGIYESINGNELIIDGLVEIQGALEKPSTEFGKEDLMLLHGVVKIFHDEIAGEEIM